MRDVVWSNSLDRFVAVGYDYSVGSALIAYSEDGSDWTFAETVGSNWLNAITWSSSLSRFVAVGNGGAIVYSTDGMSWDGAGSSGGSTGASWEDLYGVAWSEALSRFVAVGEYGAVWSSEDGDAWYQASRSALSGDLRDVAWTGSQFVSVGANGTIVYSDDGDDWFIVRSVGTDSFLTGVSASESLENVVAVGTGVTLVSP